jgi:hypothetical protein
LISNFETILTNLSPNMNPPYTKQPISSLSLDQIECFFVALEVLNGRLKKKLTTKKGAMCKKLISFEILSVW